MTTTEQKAERNKQIAATILNQLGGRKFTAMTGSKNYFYIDNGIQMTLATNMSKANKLTITLNAMDTYDMKFERFTPARYNTKTYELVESKTKLIKEYNDIFCDQLQELFTQVTGMYTSL